MRKFTKKLILMCFAITLAGRTMAQIPAFPGAGGTPCTDTDHDGMPNEWKKAHGLNPNNSADGNGTTVMNPYTNPEAYLSGLYGYSPGISETKPNFDNKFISYKSQ